MKSSSEITTTNLPMPIFLTGQMPFLPLINSIQALSASLYMYNLASFSLKKINVTFKNNNILLLLLSLKFLFKQSIALEITPD